MWQANNLFRNISTLFFLPIKLFLLLSSVYISPVIANGVYMRIDDDGVTHYSDRPAKEFKLILSDESAYRLRSDLSKNKTARVGDVLANKPLNKQLRNLSQPYLSVIHDTADRHQLPVELLLAVISVESNFNPNAVSNKGAQGLMQLMPATARRFGLVDPFRAEQNIDAGARYLRWLLDRFGSVELALAGYNAGEGSVERYGNQIPPYRETQAYVKKITELLMINSGKP